MNPTKHILSVAAALDNTIANKLIEDYWLVHDPHMMSNINRQIKVNAEVNKARPVCKIVGVQRTHKLGRIGYRAVLKSGFDRIGLVIFPDEFEFI